MKFPKLLIDSSWDTYYADIRFVVIHYVVVVLENLINRYTRAYDHLACPQKRAEHFFQITWFTTSERRVLRL